MSQVNPIPRSNGISDGEQIALRWCWTGQETLEKGKKTHFYTIEDTAVIFAVSRVFIIDFPLRHNGRPIMEGLSFLFLCVVPWWGQWLKVVRANLCSRSHCPLRDSGQSGGVEDAWKSSRYWTYISINSTKTDRLTENVGVNWKAMDGPAFQLGQVTLEQTFTLANSVWWIS